MFDFEWREKGIKFKMEQINEIMQQPGVENIVDSIIVITLSVLIYKGIAHFLKKGEENSNTKLLKSKKGKTYMKLTRSLIRYVFIVITLLIVLQINGIYVSSMLAGVGIAGVIIGFAVQDALKDIIKGINIISDSYYQVGDVIKYKDIEGKVLVVGLKTTKVEDVRTFNIVSIANRNIDQVEVVSNLINIDIPMPYEMKVVESEKVIDNILKKINDLDNLLKCEYRGVNELSESCIKYQIKVYCKPIHKVQMRRDALRCILLGLEENDIKVPYNQIDVHYKDEIVKK